MVSHWRPWRRAWVDAAYGVDGFWTRERPGAHFATGAATGPLVAEAVAGLVPDGAGVVVDVGAGDSGLLDALAGLLPGVALVGVDRRARPGTLAPQVGWVVDHWDVERERWEAGGPDRWLGGLGPPLLVAHEWLDDLPVPVVGRGPDGWHEVEVDGEGRERPAAPVSGPDAAWLARWWPGGRRGEVGRSRDAAWTGLVAAALARGGRALAVDYGHTSPTRPVDGSLTAYAAGRQRTPVPDGLMNLTAGVAMDALASAGEAAGATTLLLARQSAVLGDVPPHDDAGDRGALAALVRRSQHAALVSPARWGDLWWLLQGAGEPASLA